jgi:GntR family transcriptional regulator / MocR family aminotransferase
LSPGDFAIVEDPRFPPARQTLAMNGTKIVGVPLDGDGMVTNTLEMLEVKPPVIFTTPSHQYPCSAALPVARQLQLLEFAQESGSWISVLISRHAAILLHDLV